MSHLTYFQRRRPRRKPGELLRVRKDFGIVYFAYVGNQVGGSTFRVDREVDCRSTYSIPYTGSDFVQSSHGKFGPTTLLPAPGSGSLTYWGGYGSVAVPGPSSFSQCTVVFAAQATSSLEQSGRVACWASGDGHNWSIGLIGATTITPMSFYTGQYGTNTNYTFTTASGEASSTAVSWRGNDNFSGFRNGAPGGSMGGSSISAAYGPSAHTFLFSPPSWVVAFGMELLLYTERPVSAALLQDVSGDPWLAFEPARRSFYIATAGDVEAPTWPGGSAVTASAITHNAFTLDWDAATDNVAVTQYRYRLNAGAWTTLGNVLTTNVTGLSPGTAYSVDVQAGDAANNWSASLSIASVETDSLVVEPTIFNTAGAARASETGLKVLVLDEAPGSTATPTVLLYSSTETTDGSGVLSLDMNTSGKDPNDVVWLIVIKSDGVPANAGWSVAWPQAVEAVPA